MEFIIVTGLSGAGKSRAITALEDIGFYCVDNMPPKLLPKFAELCLQSEDRLSRVAMVVDVRGGQMFDDLFEGLQELRRMEIDYKILFLECDDQVLARRYKETRRQHPLIGDGVGSIVGSFFGGCPNTTYGESVGCVAITGNASVSTIFITAIYCIVLSFFDPFVAFVNSIPTCIVGGVCIALYGFIAVSGLKMVQNVDLGDNRNLFVVAAILVCGIGGLQLNFGPITISAIATALIAGIVVNVLFNRRTVEEKDQQ